MATYISVPKKTYLEFPFSEPVFTPLLVFFSFAACSAAARPDMGSALSDLARLGTGGGGGGGAPPEGGGGGGAGAGGAGGAAGAMGGAGGAGGPAGAGGGWGGAGA